MWLGLILNGCRIMGELARRVLEVAFFSRSDLHFLPSFLYDLSLNSAKLLTILPPPSQSLFSARATYDLVVVYDYSSSPTSPTATAVNTLVSIIYEREFTSATLKRAPVVMLGGFDAFVAEMKRPPGAGGSPLMGAGGGDGAGGLPR